MKKIIWLVSSIYFLSTTSGYAANRPWARYPKGHIDDFNVTKHHRFDEALSEFDQLDETYKKIFANPEYLKFILGNKLDLHIYGVMTPGLAQVAVYKIHQNLKSELAKNKYQDRLNLKHFNAGTALKAKSNTPDAAIINTCATIEQSLRKNGEAVMISGNSGLFGDSQIARYFTSSNFPGEIFFENACPCDFYKNLRDEELVQLINSTSVN